MLVTAWSSGLHEPGLGGHRGRPRTAQLRAQREAPGRCGFGTRLLAWTVAAPAEPGRSRSAKISNVGRASHHPNPPSASAPPTTHEDLSRAVDALVDECRVESLWFFRPDYYPRTDLERQQVLDAIQERCSRDVFRRAGTLKTWLSRLSREGSASS